MRIKMKLALTTLFSVALVVGSAATSHAALISGDLINIDLQSPNAASVTSAGDDGPYAQAGTPIWNIGSSWIAITDETLLDAGGEDDGLTLSVGSNGAWHSDTYTSASPDSTAFDYFQENAEDAMPFSIANVPAGTYELYVIAGISQWSEGQTTVVSVTGEADQNIDWTGIADLPSGTGWASGVNYVKFDVTLASLGTIDGIINGSTDTSFLHGLQLYAVHVVSESHPGDFDADEDVDGADFLKWQRGEVSSPPNASDLAAWLVNFGTTQTLLSASTATVPEPSTLLQASLAGLLFGCRRRQI
jgi:hypothetical protein